MINAGPATPAAIPISTKIPAPIMAPTPMRVASIKLISRARRTSVSNFFTHRSFWCISLESKSRVYIIYKEFHQPIEFSISEQIGNQEILFSMFLFFLPGFTPLNMSFLLLLLRLCFLFFTLLLSFPRNLFWCRTQYFPPGFFSSLLYSVSFLWWQLHPLKLMIPESDWFTLNSGLRNRMID